MTPVVIVPGTGGSQLEAKLDKPTKIHWYCSQKADWYRLWLDTSALLTGAGTECWADNIQLVWNETKSAMENAPGVTTRTPDFGGTSAIEELDPAIPLQGSAYFLPLIEALEKDMNYKRGHSIRGAPYDFRYAPSSEVGQAFQAALKQLVEETSAANSGRPVLLLAHSMGCLQSLHFLQTQSAEWKQQYIHSWVPVSAPWAGTVHELVLFASGSNEGIATVNPLTIRAEQRSYETNHWMLPNPAVFGSEALVNTSSRSYSALQYDDFFSDAGWQYGSTVYGQVKTLLHNFSAPGVSTHCWWSNGVATERWISYGKGDFPDKQPTVKTSDGDGTVNIESLEVCKQWPGVQTKVFPKTEHMKTVQIQDFIDALEQLLKASSSS